MSEAIAIVQKPVHGKNPAGFCHFVSGKTGSMDSGKIVLYSAYFLLQYLQFLFFSKHNSNVIFPPCPTYIERKRRGQRGEER